MPIHAYQPILTQILLLFDPSIFEIILSQHFHPHLILLIRVMIVTHYKRILVLVDRHRLLGFVVLQIFCVKLVEFLLRVYLIVDIGIFLERRGVVKLIRAFYHKSPIGEAVFLAPDENWMWLEGLLGNFLRLVVLGELFPELLEKKRIFFSGLAGGHIDPLRTPLIPQLIENSIEFFVIIPLE